MKKFLLAGGIALFAISCSSVKQAETAQTARAEVLKLKGDWQITSVNYEKGYKIKPFDEGADAQCFVGSQWKLVPNNYTGSYKINGGDSCPAVTQPIKFEITKDNEFKFKKINADVKAKNVVAGYILQFEKQDTNSFTLVQNVPFEGNILKVYYNFARINVSQK
jgi:hypothetical protein